MFKHLDRWRNAWPYLLFLALILFSLRDVLTLPGILGHSWDWDISASPEQIWGRLTHDFFVWDYELRGGYYSPFRTGGLFSLFALPFSFLGGVLYSRLFIIVPMFLAAICMRRFASEVLNLNAWWSTIAGVLYMLSPVVFSRILAGHNLLLPYALFPLLYVYLQRTMEGCNDERFPLKNAVIAGLLLGLEAIHVSMMVLAFVVVGLIFVFALIRSSRRLKTVFAGAIIFVIFGLLNTYWALPVGIGYTTSGTLFHSGSAIDSPTQATASSVVPQRQNLFLETMQPLAKSLRMDSFASFATEFIYPVPGILETPWLVVSYLLPILAFAVLLVVEQNEAAEFETCQVSENLTGLEPDTRQSHPVKGLGQRKQQESAIILVIAGLVGATLASGTAVPIGGLVAQWLMLHAFPVWAEFGNAVRALPLVAFALCALVPASLQKLSSRPGLAPSVAVGSAIAIGIYVSPFLAGSTMLDTRYAQSLKSFQPSAQDQQAYDLLKKEQEDFRVSYVPPPWMYYPELYDLGYEWLGGLSPHPEFFLPYTNPDAWLAPSQLQADGPGSISGKLLGLAAVKYMVYPRARFVSPSSGLFPSSNASPADNSNRARLVDQVLETQKNLQPVNAPFTETLLLRNDSYLPRIYAASQATSVQGNSDQLAAVASSSFFTGTPALFFDQQQEPAAGRRLTTIADQLVQTEQSAPGSWTNSADARLGYLLPFSPLGESTRTFSVAQQGSYSLKVSTFPFRFSSPGPSDVSSTTFSPIRSSDLAGVDANLLYNFSLIPDTNSLGVIAYFPSERSNDQFIEVNTSVEPLNLVDSPNLSIISQVDNTGDQSVAIRLHLDLEGDEGEDATWTSPLFSHAKLKTDDLNVLQAVRSEFPGKERYRVVGVTLRFLRNPQPEWNRTVYPPGVYSFWVQGLRVYGRDKPGWVWERPSNLTAANSTTLSRSVEALDLNRFPLELEYEAEGPATLYVQAQLVAHNQRGEEKILPVLGQLVAPFSHGKMTLDARDMLAAANGEEQLSVTSLQVVAHRLRGGAELRPTTLHLLRVGSRWLPTEQDGLVSPPILKLDGNPIALDTSASAWDEPLYSSTGITLSKGEHTVSVEYPAPNSAFAVDSVEIVSWPEKTVTTKPPTLTFKSINPTRWRVHVSDAQAPFFVVFSETFDPGWNAYIIPHTQSQAGKTDSQPWYEQSALLSWLFDGADAHGISDHLLVNGFANSWYVEQTGDFDIVVEFVPQRLYEAGWIVSLLTLTSAFIFLFLRHRG